MVNNSKVFSPKEFRQRVKNAHQKVKTFLDDRGNARLRQLWPDWEKRFNWLYQQSKTKPEVAISMVGGTGAGKSTLLNALVGTRVLPVSNMRACTAAISEVSYAEGPYRATIEFVTRESWQKEIDILLADLRDARFGDEQYDLNDPRLAISKAAMDRLWTVYHPEGDDNRENFDPLNIEEPEEITRILDAGCASLNNPNLKEFRKAIARYLDSKHRFWPIVKRVCIEGPFESLKDGAKLIDLPGVNDPNEAREEVTRSHLKTCRFVWIVFNIKRALTKDTMNLMQSDDFLRQIVMDGRADALTFVGTASDDIDLETAIDEFELDDEAEVIEAVQARNEAVRGVLNDQLDELSHRLAQLGQEEPDVAVKLAKKLKASQVLTVSAREYMRLEKLSKAQSAGLENLEQTEIPALRTHMSKICANYGIDSHIRSLTRQLNLLFDEIKREIQTQRMTLRNQVEVSENQRKELGAVVKTARDFLNRDLNDSQERLEQDLESSQGLLSERIKRAVDRAKLELEESTLRKWDRTHHGTIKAVCRRGGVYTGSTGRNDFPADLCKPILNGIAFSWSEFFGEKLKMILDKWTNRLRRNADGYRARLYETLSSRPDLPKSAFNGMSAIFETTDKILDEIFNQISTEMESKIIEKQRTLYEKIPEQVKANMFSAFEKAADETGAGMKQRMVEILSEHARDVSQAMFDDARETLQKGVRGLNHWLAKEYQKMIEAVQRNAKLAAENIVSGEGNLTAEKMKLQELLLNEFESIVEELTPKLAVAK